MWSSVWGGRNAHNSLHRQRKNASRTEKKYTNRYMWSARQKKMINMWSGRAENTYILLPQVLYCNLEKRDCQAPLAIKSELKIWYAVSKEKARRDHFHHVGAKPSVHTWWIWSHFAFRSKNKLTRSQKLICSKQRKRKTNLKQLKTWKMYDIISHTLVIRRTLTYEKTKP